MKKLILLMFVAFYSLTSSAQNFDDFIGSTGNSKTLYRSSITPKGTSVLYGRYQYNYSIGGLTLNAIATQGDDQLFIAVIDSNLKVNALKNLSGGASKYPMTTDKSENIIIGHSAAGQGYGESIFAIEKDTFVKNDASKLLLFSKLDKNANYLYSISYKKLTTNGSLMCFDIKTDKNNNIFLLAESYSSDSLQIGNVKFLPRNYGKSIYKFSPDGKLLWQKSVDVEGRFNNTIDAFNVNEEGEIFFGGKLNFYYSSGNSKINFGNNITLSNPNLTSNTFDVYYAKLTTDGLAQWAFLSNGSFSTTSISGARTTIPQITKFAFDHSGNVLIYGDYGTTFKIGSTTLTGNTTTNPFLLKTNHQGNPLWLKTAQDVLGKKKRHEHFEHITVDKNNNIYVVMPYMGTQFTFGDSTFYQLTASSSPNQMLCKLDSNFKFQWFRYLGARANNEDVWDLKIIGNKIYYSNDGGMAISLKDTYVEYNGITFVQLKADADAVGKTTGSPFVLKLHATDPLVTSIQLATNQEENLIYPNPFEDNIYFPAQNNKTIRVYNVQHQLVAESQIINNSINLGHLSSGLYIIEIEGNRTTIVKQ